ncbi:AAA-like domain-containing protein [Candidatus Parabeggiatoa sp. HSG14]|uniref:AAA-like domain-containing protein n=1 Tax=Candidatus Parabeggiatoa sp. HSG14 TaxID=3055593 RepID=UPI0025A92843|nr:AAA-like domain-containing protein [Thiotrichales bacterium HSG14]
MFEIIKWVFAVITTILGIIGGIAAIDYFCSGCVKKFNLIAYFRWQKRGCKLEPISEPSGTVPLNSPFYVERPPIESACYENIGFSDALIRVKAPRQMGKSSLLVRILDQSKLQSRRIVYLSFQEADNEIFSSLDRFLYWFCGSVTEQLGLPDKLDKNWQGVLGSKSKCNNYFEKYLLNEIAKPLVLGLDEVDMIFEHEAIAADFFSLLRVWHEKGKNEEPWKRLRMVITHSQEVYVPLDMKQSPFNVGIAVDLPEFTQEQVQDLARRYKQALTDEQIEQLVKLVGGHPYLLQVALYQIAHKRYTLKKLLKVAPYEDGPYSEHLRRHRLNLEKHVELANEAKRVMSADNPLPASEVNEIFRLRSMGLVKVKDDEVMPLCDLYRQYFNKRL